MTAFGAIVFDLDDTLYPEREYAWSGFRAVSEAFARELDDPQTTQADLQRLFDSQDRWRVFDALLRERFGAIDQSLLARMIDLYRRHAPVITPYPDVDTAFSRWRGRYKLGLITDGRAEAQWAKIDVLNLRPRMDHIIVTSDYPPSPLTGEGRGEGRNHDDHASPESFAKPHPRAFEDMARYCGVPHSACVYVADNVGKDFVAPNALGWLTVRIARPDGVYGGVACADGGQARHTITRLGELDPLI